MNDFIKRAGWWNLTWTVVTLGILVADLVQGAERLSVGIDVGAVAVMVSICVFRYRITPSSGGAMPTATVEDDAVRVVLSKGVEPVEPPTGLPVVSPEPHTLGTDPNCGICRSMMERE